jgi:hypothetical protein
VNRESNLGGGGAGRQGVSLNLKELFGGVASAHDRVAALEATLGRETRLGAYVGPPDATLDVLAAILDDPDPRVREVQSDLEIEVGRDLNRRLHALEDRLAKLDGGPTPVSRRRNFRLLRGGRL